MGVTNHLQFHLDDPPSGPLPTVCHQLMGVYQTQWIPCPEKMAGCRPSGERIQPFGSRKRLHSGKLTNVTIAKSTI